MSVFLTPLPFKQGLLKTHSSSTCIFPASPILVGITDSFSFLSLFHSTARMSCFLGEMRERSQQCEKDSWDLRLSRTPRLHTYLLHNPPHNSPARNQLWEMIAWLGGGCCEEEIENSSDSSKESLRMLRGPADSCCAKSISHTQMVIIIWIKVVLLYPLLSFLLLTVCCSPATLSASHIWRGREISWTRHSQIVISF